MKLILLLKLKPKDGCLTTPETRIKIINVLTVSRLKVFKRLFCIQKHELDMYIFQI